MISHTPGPWIVDPDERLGMHWNNHILSARDPNIAICFMSHDGTKENAMGRANARLIAAAPDLYEALADATLIIDRYAANPQDCVVRLEAWLPKAIAAIAKAEGKA